MDDAPQDSSLIESLGIEDDSLYDPLCQNERTSQEIFKWNQKGTQTSFILQVNNDNGKQSYENEMNISTENRNGSLNKGSIYDSFSVESKYDSFDDSLDEEAQHKNQKEINVSQFLSDQVNVTVRKTRDRQKFRSNHLCDSLEDICSLVSNAEHFSTSDEIESINIFEKHGIYDDSLRNDICHDKRNVSSNEQGYDDDSLAILEVEKTFDDSLEDGNIVSCVDSLILRNSIGDTDVIVEKFENENICGTRNLFETSVPVIYENTGNGSMSDDESFKTAENLNSDEKSQSISECHLSKDSLEEIGDISEHIPSILSEKSDCILKETCHINSISHISNITEVDKFIQNDNQIKVHNDNFKVTHKLQSNNGNIENRLTTPNSNDVNSSTISFVSVSSTSSPNNASSEKNMSSLKMKPKLRDVDLNSLATHKLESSNGNIENRATTPKSNDVNTSSTNFVSITSTSSPDDTSSEKSVSSSLKIKPKLRDIDLNSLMEQNNIKIIRISEEFEREQTRSLLDDNLIPTSSAEKKTNLKPDEISFTTQCDRDEITLYNNGTVIGEIMNIDTKYVIEDDFESPKINQDFHEKPGESSSKFHTVINSLPIYNNDSFPLNKSKTKAIKVIKCTGMMDGKISTIYLDASPIMHAFDGQEIKFQVVDFDIGTFKQKSDHNYSKKYSESSYDLISTSVSKETSTLVCNGISTTLEKLSERNEFPSGNSNTNLCNENMNIHVQRPVKELPSVHVNASFSEQSLQNKMCKSDRNNKKIMDKKDTTENLALKTQKNENLHLPVESKKSKDSLGKIIVEAHKKIPYVASTNICGPEYSLNSYVNQEKFQIDKKINLSLHNVPLLQALDLHDSSFRSSAGKYLQSRDSITPLNLCIRNKSSGKVITNFASLSDCKENFPLSIHSQTSGEVVGTKIQKSKTPVKQRDKQLLSPDEDLKKSGSKINSSTKIPVLKADVSTPLKRKLKKQECASCDGKAPSTVNKKQPLSTNHLHNMNSAETSKKHHFCTVRNSISRVPKSTQKPNAKKFQKVESPVAKYIRSDKVRPLKITHHYDPNLCLELTPSSGKNTKATNSACIKPSQNATMLKIEKKQ